MIIHYLSFSRTNDIIDEIQQPCSEVLVRLCRARPSGGGGNSKSGGGSYIERVMEAVMGKFQPGATTHYYVITTISAIAVVNPIGKSRLISELQSVNLIYLALLKRAYGGLRGFRK